MMIMNNAMTKRMIIMQDWIDKNVEGNVRGLF
jgi:hypothetical protein